jgi:hypothetical protein
LHGADALGCACRCKNSNHRATHERFDGDAFAFGDFYSLAVVVAVRWPCASDLERWGEQGNVVRKGLLVNKVELIGDRKESGPFPENDAWRRYVSM